MSHDATHILDEVGMAQTALASGDKAAAERDITMALNARNKLAMTAKAHNLPMVVPIFSELEDSTTLGAVVAQKNNGQAMPAVKTPVAVDSVTGQFTFVGIDLDRTKAKLNDAEQSLKSGNVQDAQAKLQAIGDVLVVGKADAAAPLLAIRENLGLAHGALMNKHEKEATAALQQAGVELAAYAQQSGASHQQDAQSLKADIDKMLSMNGQMQAGAKVQVEGWWSEVNSWIPMPGA